MLQSNLTARSGLIAQQQRMDVIANNIANISTTGYKPARADFKDMLYQTMVRPVQPQDGLNLQKGHGVLLGATMRDFSQGSAQVTEDPLDVMLVGDAFLAIQDINGDTLYTRDGNFALSEEDGTNYLVTEDGRYVLDVNGNRINLGPTEPSGIEIQTDASVWIVETVPATETTPEETVRTQVATLGLYTFMNRQGLEAVSANRFRETENSGAATAAAAGETQVRQGMLEASKVDLAYEITQMIRAQRSLSLSSRALQTADDMDGKANQLRA